MPYGYRERLSMNLTDITNLRIEAYSDHPEVYAVAEWLVNDYMASQQRIRDREQYLRTARKLIASIWNREGDLFKFTTKASYFSPKTRKQVWMTRKTLTLFQHLKSIEPKLINIVQDAIPPYASKTDTGFNTVYCRTQLFKDKFHLLTEADIAPNPDLFRIELNSDDEKNLPIDESIQNKRWFKQTISVLEAQYELLKESHLRNSERKPISPAKFFYQRKFKNDFNHGGRLYAPFCTWSKRERLSVTFNNEPAISLDISQLHPSLIMRLFFSTDIEPEGMLRGRLKDAYDMPSYLHFPRVVHKKLINTLFNSKSEDSALRSIMTAHLQVNSDNEYVCVTYKGKKERKGAQLFKNKKNAESYINHFKLMHPYYAEAICSGVGSKLQKLDSDFVIQVVHIANELGIPCLPIHDEFVFPETFQSLMELAIQRSFQSVFGNKGKLGKLSLSKSKNDSDTENLVIDLFQ